MHTVSRSPAKSVLAVGVIAAAIACGLVLGRLAPAAAPTSSLEWLDAPREMAARMAADA